MTQRSGRDDVFPLGRRLDWELTKGCNLHCAHCISRYVHEKVPQELSEADAHRVIERCHEAGVGAIHFFGGEPTTRRDLPEILAHCDERAITTTFNTNGTHLDDVLLEALAGLRHRRPLLFSFEDIREKEAEAIRGLGSFAAALSGIRRFHEALPEGGFVIAFTLTRPAISTLSPQEILEFFGELGADRVVFQDLAAPADASDELARLAYSGELWLEFIAKLHESDRPSPLPFTYRLKPLVIDHLNRRLGTAIPIVYYGCNGLSTELRLLPNGTLLPCSAAVGWPEALDLYLDKAPTLVDCSLEELLLSDHYQQFSRCKLQRDIDPMMEPCRRCRFAYLQCNPCVFGRLMDRVHAIQTCRWAYDSD